MAKKKMETLTDEQRAQLPEFIQKWVDIPTTEVSDADIIDVAQRMYKAMGEEPPVVLIFDSPLACELVGNFLKNSTQLDRVLNIQPFSQIASPLISQLESQLESRVTKQAISHLESLPLSEIEVQINSHHFSQVNDQLYSKFRSRLNMNISSELEVRICDRLSRKLVSDINTQISDQIHSELTSHENLEGLGVTNLGWATWAGLYDFGRHIGVEFDQSAFDLFLDFNKVITYSIPLKGIFITTRKPTKVLRWDGFLHGEGENAVEFADGWGWYANRGVVEPEEIGRVHPSEWGRENAKT